MLGLLKALGLDLIVYGGIDAIKSGLKFLADQYSSTTGNPLSGIDLTEIRNLLGTDAHDEVELKKALLLVGQNTEFAWGQKVAIFETLLSDPKEAELVKEFYRRLTASTGTTKQIAAAIEHDANLHIDVWNGTVEALSLRRKALESKYKKFLDWAKKNGKNLLADWDTKAQTAAVAIDDWTTNFLRKHGR